jgi:hypothetical protein
MQKSLFIAVNDSLHWLYNGYRVPSKRVMSSPFLHKTISFSEFCVGDLMLYVAIKFDYKMSQMLVWPFLAFANI